MKQSNLSSPTKRPWWQSGQALVEFSLILPILLFIILGIIDYGRILFIYANVSSSIRDAARNATIFTPDSASVPRYASCTTIDTMARNIIFNNAGNFVTINSVNILYFNTKQQPPLSDTTALAALATRIDAASTDPTKADFDCSSTYSPPQVSAATVGTGDLLMVTMNVRIDFITPLLANMFPSLQLDFKAQRTIVASLTLSPTDEDRDNDGLLDSWEFEKFGCLLENYDEEPLTSSDVPVVAIRRGTDTFLIIAEAGSPVVAGWGRTGFPPPSSATNPALWERGAFTGECALEDLLFNDEWLASDPNTWPKNCVDATINNAGTTGDTTDDFMEGCYVPNTFEFNATDDPDSDGCNNGCEEATGGEPLNGLPGAAPEDSDQDGVEDGPEANGYSLPPSCTVNGLPYPADGHEFVTNPIEEDTDEDGLKDGFEISICSDPTVKDTDGDGLFDGDEVLKGTMPNKSDTDSDGIDDRREIIGYNLPNITVDGVSRPKYVRTDPTDFDTDGDNIGDGDEANGTGAAAGYFLDPTAIDTDGDFLNDDDEFTAGTFPNTTDWDGDKLVDGREVNTYYSLPKNVNTDGDSCADANGASQSLDDYFEVMSREAVGNEDADGDGLFNNTDLESDTDSLPDCLEAFYYGTNPYDANTDGDDMADDLELDIYCRDPNDPADAGIMTEADCVAGGSADADGDGLPDLWEEQYYTPKEAQDGTSDLDNDRCNNACEFDRRTSPNDEDWDNDGLYDGDEVLTKPKEADSDGDGLLDGSTASVKGELNGSAPAGAGLGAAGWGTDPNKADTDLDGLEDDEEVLFYLTLPLDFDSDDDGLLDGYEVKPKTLSLLIDGASVPISGVVTNALAVDSDNDGLTDYNETINYKTNPADATTDNDLLPDGTTAALAGERNNDADPTGLPGIGTDPLLTDSDNDGVSDDDEYNGIDDYVIVLSGVPQAPIDLPGYADRDSDPLTLEFGMTNPDSDGDGWYDGREISEGTNPLSRNTDNDSYTLDSTDPLPLTPQGSVDSDGDGLIDSVEIGATPPTYAIDPDGAGPINPQDSDGDGMKDGAESLPVNLTATGYNLATNSTFAITYSSPPNVQLVTTYQDANGDGVLDGYDSDGDGLSDTFEMYWYQSDGDIQAIHSFHTAFSGTMESCLFALTGSQPLHPFEEDTDGDHLLDGDECNIYQTNPFVATAEGQAFDKISNDTFLNSVVYPALEGDLALASASARALGYTVSTDGRITLRIVRSFVSGNAAPYQLMGTLITAACGPTAYTNSSGVTTMFTNVCGVYSAGSEPSNTTVLVQVRVPLSQLFTILKSTKVASVSP
jgi:Flp pilus assembly protein TadG